jgi:hypothetical protein
MRRLLAALIATQLAACASGMRPVKQLEDGELMVGAGLNGPGAEFDPEVSAWLRFAPWRHVDLTVGGLVTIPLFEPVAAGGLAEVRGHVPLTRHLRLTLDVAGELISYDVDDAGRRIWVTRLTAMPLLVWLGAERLSPYFGPKVMYLSHMDTVSGTLAKSPGFREDGAGEVLLGGTFGAEGPVDSLCLGAAIDLGMMADAETGDLDGLYLNVAGYIAY